VTVKDDDLARSGRLRVTLADQGHLSKEIHGKTFQNNRFDDFEVAKFCMPVRISQSNLLYRGRMF